MFMLGFSIGEDYWGLETEDRGQVIPGIFRPPSGFDLVGLGIADVPTPPARRR